MQEVTADRDRDGDRAGAICTVSLNRMVPQPQRCHHRSMPLLTSPLTASRAPYVCFGISATSGASHSRGVLSCRPHFRGVELLKEVACIFAMESSKCEDVGKESETLLSREHVDHRPTSTLHIHHLLLASTLCFLLGVGVTATLAASSHSRPSPPIQDAVSLSTFPFYFHPIHERTLVLYVFSANDAAYIDNLRFFILHAVHSNDPADYVIILQQDSRYPVNSTHLPSLPRNARYVSHVNECFDWGTYGWFLRLPSSAGVDVTLYKYFILLNASVRGPFVPAYVEQLLPFEHEHMSWTAIFTQHIRRYADTSLAVHYVGVTAACWMESAHIQSYLVAFDHFALRLLNASHAFDCHPDFSSAVNIGEFGASNAILAAGANIASIASYAEGWDHRPLPRTCDGHAIPLEKGVDGVALDPLDLVFSKYRAGPLKTWDSPSAFEQTQRYDQWAQQRAKRRAAISQNDDITSTVATIH